MGSSPIKYTQRGLWAPLLVHHSPAAYIASLCTATDISPLHRHLADAILQFNNHIPQSAALSIPNLSAHMPSQKKLSDLMEEVQFSSLLEKSSLADRARLLSITSPHAAAWISVTPSISQGLHLLPDEFQVAVQWWLGINPSPTSNQDGFLLICPFCPSSTLDTLGHHCVTCRCGGDVMTWHNALRSVLYTTLHRAGLSAHLEEGSSWSIEKPKSRPADILVANWDRGFSAAFDVSVTSPLNPLHIVEAGISPGAAAKATEERKHRNNDAKCAELGWCCIPMVVESYGCWGTEARQALSQMASRLAVRTNTYKSQMLNSLYGRVNLTLIRCNARAILSRSHFASCEQVVPDDVFVYVLLFEKKKSTEARINTQYYY